jgi:hypothetical protein
MKWMPVFFSCLLTSLVILSGSRSSIGADLTETTAAFTTNCTASVLAKQGTGALDVAQRIQLGSNKNYKINVYRPKTDATDVKQIIVWIGKGDTPSTLEVPRVTDICLDGNPQINFGKGDIDFGTVPGHTVAIKFHLNNINSITWKQLDGKKAKPSDSIWLVQCTGQCSDDKHPYRIDWPDCFPPQQPPLKKDDYVQFSGNGLDMSFLLCSRTNSNVYYTYELHMIQTDNDLTHAKVDVAIDPQIINHPPVLRKPKSP